MSDESIPHLDAIARSPRVAPIRTVAGACGVVAAFWGLSLADRWAYHALLAPQTEHWPLVRALKWLGTLWPWLMIGAALVAVDAMRARRGATPSMRAWWARGAALLASAAGGGALAEILKIVFRRVRPEHSDGYHAFRAFDDRPFYSGGLDLPSSHAGTALGAAFGLALLFPRWWAAWVAVGAACAITRVLEGAHFASSVFLAGAISWAVARTIGRSMGLREC